MFHTQRLTAIAVLLGASGIAQAATCPPDYNLGSSEGIDLIPLLGLGAPTNTCGMLNDFGTTLGDTVSCANGQNSEDISFVWTAPRTDNFRITTNGSTFDTALQVRSYVAGVDCGATELACDDDGGDGTQSLIVLPATAGTQYLIVVDGYSGTNCGDYFLAITCADDDDFDGVCNAVDMCWGNDALGDSDGDGSCDDLDLCVGDDTTGDNDGDGICNDTDSTCDNFIANLGSAVGAGVATGSTVGAGDAIYAYCALNGNSTAGDVQYLWTAPAAGDYTFDLGGSSYDTVLLLGDPGDCGQSALNCNDDSIGLQSSLTQTLSAGDQIVISIDGYAAAAGDYILNITSNICLDDDGDGICNDVDVCFGDDATGDGDADGLCDDLDVVLDVSPISGGSPVDFVVVHPAWGGRVYVLGSFSGPGAGPCLPSAGVCAGLVNPFVVGGAPADPLGVTVITRTPPASLRPGRNVAFQAGVVDPPNSTGQMSNIVIRTTM